VSWWDVIGWAGSALLVWSLLQARILRLRAINLAGCAVLITYNSALRVWPMVGLNVALAVINVYYLRKLLATRHDDRAYQVVEVGVDDDFLAHVLRVHAADIARFNPGFAAPGTGPGDAPGTGPGDAPGTGAGRCAFLVVSGDEVVGAVLVRDAGDGVARVELDYVTPRFRDFTPGEFVYRRSRLFTARGFRRVLTPPGMVAPYYPRLGFRPHGEEYLLDLEAEPPSSLKR
jgi:hypothetical protein